MKRLTSINYSNTAFNVAFFLLRVSLGILLISHGYSKLTHFSQMKNNFVNFLGIGSTASLGLVVFAEVFCSIFLILGLFTRLAVIPILVSLAVALYKVHHLNIFGDGEKAALYFVPLFAILLCGPGKISLDGFMK